MVKVFKFSDGLPPFDDLYDSIIQGNALPVLKAMPKNRYDCVITSPPYYGKVCYGTDPVIWDADPDCDHEWEVEIRHIKVGVSDSNTLHHSSSDKHQERDAIIEHATCVHCPAWKGELGQEPHYWMFINHLYQIFMEVKRVLKPKGQFFLNMGDSYYGSGGWGKIKLKKKKTSGVEDRTNQTRFPTILTGNDYKHKCMMMIPTRLVQKLVDEGGWWLRNINIWHIPNKKPESVKDRFSNKYEYMFLLTKSRHYESDLDSVKIKSKTYETDKRSRRGEKIQYKGKSKKTSEFTPSKEFINPGDVWSIPTAQLKEEHFATFPPDFVKIPVQFGSPKGGLILDPFMGAGTTGLVAKELQRHFIGIELSQKFIDITRRRYASKGNMQIMYGANVKKLFRKKLKKKEGA